MKAPFCAAIDWGSSTFRLWLLADDGAVLAERRSGEGMLTTARADFGPVMDRHLDTLGAAADLPAVICGMAGSRQGWREARYLDTPASLAAVADNAVRIDGVVRDVRILPGIAQRLADRPDVMRGEETQLIGASGAAPGDALVCLPGTHSKWVRLTQGRVQEFTTFLTGEMFAAFGRHTILSHAIDAGAGNVSAHPAFAESVGQALEHAGNVMNRLFTIRSGQLLGMHRREEGMARLSGLLIGSEIAGAKSLREGVTRVRLVASGSLVEPYRKALEMAGLDVDAIDADAAVRSGLYRAARSIWSSDVIVPAVR